MSVKVAKFEIKIHFFPYILIFLLYKTNRFHVAVRLFSNRSQMTWKCGKNISDTLGCASCATFLFLPHLDVICDLLLNRRTATWNLFVKYITTTIIQEIRFNQFSYFKLCIIFKFLIMLKRTYWDIVGTLINNIIADRLVWVPSITSVITSTNCSHRISGSNSTDPGWGWRSCT